MKKVSAAIICVMMMSGCAVQEPMTKQAWMGWVMNQDLASKIIAERPDLVYCFGGDRQHTWRQLDDAIDDSLKVVGADMPDVVEDKKTLKPYAERFGLQAINMYIERNWDHFSLEGLNGDQKNTCLQYVKQDRIASVGKR